MMNNMDIACFLNRINHSNLIIRNMKRKTAVWFLSLLLAVAMTHCFVWSFYPLFTPGDLRPNDLLAGEWLTGDSTGWKFGYLVRREKESPPVADSTTYVLTFREKDEKWSGSSMLVRVVSLDGNLFLDFFINEIEREGYPDFFDLHTFPVHTFARLTQTADSLQLQWMDPGWMKRLAGAGKLKIRHLMREDEVLLTAPTGDLQKFVVKHARNEEAWKDGMSITLTRPQ